MKDLDAQINYWDSVALKKTFSHPVPLSTFSDLLPLTARILDYGCGYGRVCSELLDFGYCNVVGLDISPEMVKRGKSMDHRLDLRTFDGLPTHLSDGHFDLCLLLTVLTCIPSDEAQKKTIHEIHRLLRPGGILFVSDMPLQTDTRNQRRYHDFEKEFGIFGVFRTEEAIVRHHDMKWIHQLLSAFNIITEKTIRVMTMNGHEADAFQIAGRKKCYD